MTILWMMPLLAQLGAGAKEKLFALGRISGHSEADLVPLILEGGILDAWEGYRKNPKHTKQVEEFEKRGINGESGIFK